MAAGLQQLKHVILLSNWDRDHNGISNEKVMCKVDFCGKLSTACGWATSTVALLSFDVWSLAITCSTVCYEAPIPLLIIMV